MPVSGYFSLFLPQKSGSYFFPNCKINHGLRVVAKRTDRCHDIETVMYPVRGLCDALEILPDATDDISFTSSGLETGVDPERNICVRAYRAFREACPIGGVRMHLHKTIPMGAGLGGGSADAAFTIKGLAELFGVPLTAEQMIRLAAQVGSDVPFFIDGRPTLATGRGGNTRSRSGVRPIGPPGWSSSNRTNRSVRPKPTQASRPHGPKAGSAICSGCRSGNGKDASSTTSRHPFSAFIRRSQRSKKNSIGGGSLCFHVRFGICRLRNFRRADAGSAGHSKECLYIRKI